MVLLLCLGYCYTSMILMCAAEKIRVFKLILIPASAHILPLRYIYNTEYIVYLLRKVCTRVHALPYLQFESLLPHIKLSGCKIDVYYSPVMH